MGRQYRTEAEKLNRRIEQIYAEASAAPPAFTAREILARIDALTKAQIAIVQSLSALETKVGKVQNQLNRR